MHQDGLRPVALWVVSSCKRHKSEDGQSDHVHQPCPTISGSSVHSARSWELSNCRWVIWLQRSRSGSTAPSVLPRGPGAHTSALGILVAGSSQHIPQHRRLRSHFTLFFLCVFFLLETFCPNKSFLSSYQLPSWWLYTLHLYTKWQEKSRKRVLQA